MSIKQTGKRDLPGKSFRLPSFSLSTYAVQLSSAHTCCWPSAHRGFQHTYLSSGCREAMWGDWVVKSDM